MQSFNKDNYINLEFNGYHWFGYHKGIHSFKKRSDNGLKWIVVECTEKQLYNGDIQFMTKHGITLTNESKRKVKRKVVC